MTTDTKTEEIPVTIEQIRENLKVTDEKHNRFQFSVCRDRHIVVLGTKKTKNYVVGDIIQHDTYQRRKDEHKTRSYVMVYDDPLCNICVINLIDIQPLENFLSRIEKDPSSSPMAYIDEAIHKFATSIDLIILVCEKDNYDLMKNMKKWTSDRGFIMAIVFIVEPNLTLEEREEYLCSIRSNIEFRENDLESFFEKGIFCISDLSYNHFKTMEERQIAQNNVEEWRSKFLQTCVGGKDDKKYEIILSNERQSKKTTSCILS